MGQGQTSHWSRSKVDLEGQGQRVKVNRLKMWFQVLFDRLTCNGQGQESGSKVMWVKVKGQVGKPNFKVMILAGGLMSTSSCIFNGIALSQTMAHCGNDKDQKTFYFMTWLDCYLDYRIESLFRPVLIELQSCMIGDTLVGLIWDINEECHTNTLIKTFVPKEEYNPCLDFKVCHTKRMMCRLLVPFFWYIIMTKVFRTVLAWRQRSFH